MHKFSEVEIKLDATGLSPKKFMQFVIDSDIHIERIKIVSGTDVYYKNGTETVRHRCDGKEQKSVLTVKKRKSKDSIIDRIEIDLPIQDGVSPEMVSAFLFTAGWRQEFTINKKYHIFNVSEKDYEACIALYDVWKSGESGKRFRFLEVEIERDSSCSPKMGEKYLKDWLERIKKSLLPDAKPLNSSLYELFSTKEK